MGARWLAVRRAREHSHREHSRRDVSAGHLAIPSAHAGVRTFRRRRRQHLGRRFRPAWQHDRRHELGRCRHAAPGAGRLLRERVLQAWRAAESARLRLLRACAVHRLQRWTRHLRRDRLSGRFVPRAISRSIHRRQRPFQRHLLAHDRAPGLELHESLRRRAAHHRRSFLPARRLHRRAGWQPVRRRLVRQACEPRRPQGRLGPHERPDLQSRGRRHQAGDGSRYVKARER